MPGCDSFTNLRGMILRMSGKAHYLHTPVFPHMLSLVVLVETFHGWEFAGVG